MIGNPQANIIAKSGAGVRLGSILVTVFTLMIFSGGYQSVSAHVFGDPPDEHHPWGMQDLNRPHPPVITPGEKIGDPPSDAVILFDGSEESFANWRHVKPENKRKGEWKVEGGILLCTPGAGFLTTVEEFGDCQLHVEWAPPVNKEGTGQKRGNSGVFLMGKVEVQVLDNFENPTYADGTAGAIYGVMPPMVNALKGPDAWQSYDIIFRRPIVKNENVLDPGSITVLVNGVVVQASVLINGGGGYRKRTGPEDSVKFPDRGPLMLQDHGNPVRYRNIWYRPLRPRPVDGGTDGRLDPEVALGKRAEIAQDLREKAKSLTGYKKAFMLMDSQLYQVDPASWQEAEQLAEIFARKSLELSDEQIRQRKGDIIRMYRMIRHLRKFGRISDGQETEALFKKIIDLQGWKVRP